MKRAGLWRQASELYPQACVPVYHACLGSTPIRHLKQQYFLSAREWDAGFQLQFWRLAQHGHILIFLLGVRLANEGYHPRSDSQKKPHPDPPRVYLRSLSIPDLEIEAGHPASAQAQAAARQNAWRDISTALPNLPRPGVFLKTTLSCHWLVHSILACLPSAIPTMSPGASVGRLFATILGFLCLIAVHCTYCIDSIPKDGLLINREAMQC